MDKFKLIYSLNAACYQILSALARLLLRYGVGYTAFAEVSKRAFIDVAWRDFALPGKKQTVSRVSALTGISRKEVGLVLKQAPLENTQSIHINRIARVISGWLNDKKYLDEQQCPVDLSFEGDISFSSLVKTYSGDLTPKTIADELLRNNAIKMLPGGFIRLSQHAYIPNDDVIKKMDFLGTDVSDLIHTISHNIKEPEVPFFQRKVLYQNIDPVCVDKLRSELNHLNQEYLEKMQQLIHSHGQSAKGQRKKRLGVGIYYIEEDLFENDNQIG